MVRIFRTKPRYWLAKIALIEVPPLLFPFLLWWVLPAPRQNGSTLAVLAACSVLPILPHFAHFVPAALRAFIQVDTGGINGQVGRQKLSIAWTALVAAEMQMRIGGPVLALATMEQSWLVPLVRFDHQEIWRLVQQYAPPRALEKDALESATFHEARLQSEAQGLRGVPLPLRVINAYCFQAGLGSAIICLIVAAGAQFDPRPNPVAALFIVAMSLLGVWLMLCAGHVELDEEEARFVTLFARRAMRWDEIQVAVTDCLKSKYLLMGDGKQLALPGLYYWGGRDRETAQRFLEYQLSRRHLRLQEDTKGEFLTTKIARQK